MVGEGLLAGLRVVEVSSFVAAPLGGMTLAQLGAEVVRVDPVGGGPDIGRWPVAESGTSLYWAGLNQGKRSVTVDFGSPEGRERVGDLVARAGVLLTNAGGRGFLDDAVLRERRPDLIHLRIQGRHDGRPAVDYTVNAGVGFPLVTGPPEHDGPVNHVLPAWDVACGLYAALGIAAAERRRARTGEGCFVRVALEDVALAMAGNLGFLAEAQFGVARERVGNHLYGGFARDFTCRDGGRVMVVALTEHQWRALRQVTGTEEVFHALEQALDVDFNLESDRYRLRETIAAILRPWFAARDFATVSEDLDAARVLWSRYRGMVDVAAEFRASGAPSVLASVEQPGIGPAISARSPLRWSGEYDEAAPAPTLGEHTDEVLSEVLGLDPAELGKLHDSGVLASAGR